MSTLASVILDGVASALPAASIPGRLYFTTDTLQVLRDNGTSWDNVTPTNAKLIQGVAISTAAPTSGQVLEYNGTQWAPTTIAASGGTVTSVALSAPSRITVTGSPITGAGTLALTDANQNANQVFAGPASGAAATPGFRVLAPADLPVATTSAFGAVKPDGTTVTIASGVLSATGGSSVQPYLVPSPNTGSGTEASPYTDTVDLDAGIQAAINTLESGRGGQVLLKSSRYDITSTAGIVINTSGTQIVGVAGGANIMPDGLNEGITGTKIRSTVAGLAVGGGNTISGNRIEELYMWGAVAGTDVPALDITGYCDQLVVNRLRVGGNWKYGIRLLGNGTNTLDAAHFLSCTVDGISGHGAYITNANSKSYFTKFTMCEFDDNQGYGFYVNNTTQSQAFGAAVTQWMRLESCSFMRNGQSGGTDAANVYLYSHQCVLSNCVVWESGITNGGTAVATADGIIVGGNNNIITGCQFSSNNGYAIRIRGNNNIIVANEFLNPVTGNIIIEAGATGNVIIQPGLTGITDNGSGTINVSSASELQGVPISPITPTSGQVLTYNGTQWIATTGGGTAGVSSLNTLAGALSITAGTGISVSPSGTSIQITNTGSGGTAASGLFGSLIPIKPSQAASGLTTAYNHSGTLSVTDTSSGITLIDGTSSAGLFLEGQLGAYPSTPFTRKALVSVPFGAVDYVASSMVIASSLTGAALYFGLVYSGGWTAAINTATGPSAYGTGLSTYALGSFSGPFIWLELVDNGTTVQFSVSPDGQVWTPVGSAITKSTSNLGPSGFNYLGFAISPQGTGFGSTLMAWS